MRCQNFLLFALFSGLAACSTGGGSGASGDGAGVAPGGAGDGTGVAPGGAGGGGNVMGPQIQEPPPLGTEGNGNQVNHEQLFQCTNPEGSGSARRVWRLSSTQYDQTVRTLAGKDPIPGFIAPFGGTLTLTRFSNFASSFGMTELDTETLLDSSLAASAAILAKLERSIDTKCLQDPIDAVCARSVLSYAGKRLKRRPLTEAELDTHLARFATLSETLGVREALEMEIQVLLVSPQTVFRMELGDGTPDGSGRTRLTQYEVASLIAYTVDDKPPDAELMKAAEEGKLGTKTEIAAQVRRLLGEVPSAKGSMKRFFREYWRYPDLLKVFQGEFNGNNKPEDLVERADAFVAHVVDQGSGLLGQMLRSHVSSVSDRAKVLYGYPAGNPQIETMLLEFPERFGMLSQPAWLFAHSQSDETDPIHRGKFVYESLLCNTVPDIPIDVVPLLPEIDGATQRERLAVHTENPSCAACHSLMDPIGLGFEHFDHLGRYRTEEQGKPVNATGVLVGSGTQDGPFVGVDELTGKLAASPRTAQCFVRHAFRYWMGRNEGTADACSLGEVSTAFAQAESAADLIATIIASDSVMYRLPEETSEAQK